MNYYWVKASQEARNNGGWSIPAWYLCYYKKGGSAGFRERCLSDALDYSGPSGHHINFWGDEPKDVLDRFMISIVVDWEGPVKPPER